MSAVFPAPRLSDPAGFGRVAVPDHGFLHLEGGVLGHAR